MSGNLLSQWEMFDLMEATWPRLAKNLNELKDDVKTSDWSLQPWAQKKKKPSPEAQRRSDLVEHCLWNMTPASGRRRE
jgi:phage gp29-like protein